MKTITKLFGTAIVLLLFTTGSFAQVTVTADASAMIVAPITMVWESDLEFANVAVQAGTGGTVVMAPINPITRGIVAGEMAYGGCTLPLISGETAAAAEFNVAGEVDYHYTITLPASCIITRTGGLGETMTVNAFTSNPTSPGDLGATGTQTLYVGATLNVAAGQVPGHYEAVTDFPVTVNYN
jgi:hypothetical protein